MAVTTLSPQSPIRGVSFVKRELPGLLETIAFRLKCASEHEDFIDGPRFEARIGAELREAEKIISNMVEKIIEKNGQNEEVLSACSDLCDEFEAGLDKVRENALALRA